MALMISRGPKAAPLKALLYGPAGSGKTTLAAKLPAPLFLGEAGTNQLDVARVERDTWTYTDVWNTLDALARDPGEFRTLVVDTLDWLSERVDVSVCANYGNSRTVEEIPYGKGKGYRLEEWRELVVAFDRLLARGVNVLLVAHAASKTIKNPSGDDYDRYAMRLNEDVAAMLYGWVDAALFVSRNANVEKGKNGRARATGFQRFVYLDDAPGLFAKCRWPVTNGDGQRLARVTFERDMSPSKVARLFNLNGAPPKVQPGATTSTPTQGATPQEPTPSVPGPASSPPAAAEPLSRSIGAIPRDTASPTRTASTSAVSSSVVTPSEDTARRAEIVRLIGTAPEKLAEEARRILGRTGVDLVKMRAWLVEEIAKATAPADDSIGAQLGQAQAAAGHNAPTSEPASAPTKAKRAPRRAPITSAAPAAPKTTTSSPASVPSGAEVSSTPSAGSPGGASGSPAGASDVVVHAGKVVELSAAEEERLWGEPEGSAPWQGGER